MSRSVARDSEVGIDGDEFGTGVHDLGAGDLGIHAGEAGSAPATELTAVADFGDGLERHELDPSDQEWLVPTGQRGAWDQPRAEHVSVDDHRPTTRPVGHGSAPDGVEEGFALLRREIVDHLLAVGKVLSAAT